MHIYLFIKIMLYVSELQKCQIRSRLLHKPMLMIWPHMENTLISWHCPLEGLIPAHQHMKYCHLLKLIAVKMKSLLCEQWPCIVLAWWCAAVFVWNAISPSSSLEVALFESGILSICLSSLEEKGNLSFWYSDGPLFFLFYCKERRKERSFNILVMD